MVFIAPIIFGICIVAGAFGVLNYIKSAILQKGVWTQIKSIYLPAFCCGWLLMLIIVQLSIRKPYKRIYPVYVLIDRYIWTVNRLDARLQEKKG